MRRVSLAGAVMLLLAVSISLQPICGKSTPWDTQMKSGKDALKSGDYGEARRSLQMALESSKMFQTNDTRLAETYQALGELYLGDQEYPQAKEYFNRALMVEQARPGYDELKLADTLWGLSNACEMLGDREMAVVLLRRVRDIWTKTNGAHSAKLIGVLKPLGIYATVNGDFRLAEECYREMVAIQEQTGGADSAALGSALNLYASALTKNGKLEDASSVAERAVRLLGQNPDASISAEGAQQTLAYVNQELGKKPPVVQEAAKPPVVQEATKPPVVQEAAKQPVVQEATKPPVVKEAAKPPVVQEAAKPPVVQEAAKPPVVQEAAKPPIAESKSPVESIPPKSVLTAPRTSSVTTSSEFRPWELNKEIPRSGATTSSDPNYGKIRYLAGGKLITKEEYQAMLLANEAYELIKTEKYKMACDVLRKALAIAPSLASARTNMGLALTQLGQNDEAIEHLKTAVAVDPDRGAAWLNLASAFQLGGQLKAAQVTYSEYVRRFPADPMAAKARELAKLLDKEVKEQATIADSNGGVDYFAFASHEGAVRWADQAEHIKVYIAPVSGVATYHSEYDGFAQEAFNEWGSAAHGKIAFDFVKKPDQANIDWVWTDDPRKVSSVAEGGEANVSYAGSKISHATITVLTKHAGMESPLSPNQIRAVSLHEIGHALGLIGHSPRPQDIMFCSMPPAVARPSLSARDVATISKLYAAGISSLPKVVQTL